MKVQSSAVDLYGDYKLEQQKTVHERLRVWGGGSGREANIVVEGSGDSLLLSEDALAILQQEAAKAEEASQPKELVFELSAKDKEIIDLLERFLSRLTGKSVKLKIPEKIIWHDAANLSMKMADGGKVDIRNGSQGWGLDYHYEESYSEKETMSFSSQGTIQTEDGREIEFKLSLEMSREFFSAHTIDIKAGEALIDPLVINYGGGRARLTDLRMDFDLDGDGEKESMAVLEEGSGFLALDKNNDGSINDGTELFGPSSGDGFAELAGYDSDENGWLDENDPVFEQLKIWIKDADNNEKLVALGQIGIGAIYLGNVETRFSLKDSSNDTLGKIQQTGIFLKEDGQAGTIQHIDLAV